MCSESSSSLNPYRRFGKRYDFPPLRSRPHRHPSRTDDNLSKRTTVGASTEWTFLSGTCRATLADCLFSPALKFLPLFRPPFWKRDSRGLGLNQGCFLFSRVFCRCSFFCISTTILFLTRLSSPTQPYFIFMA